MRGEFMGDEGGVLTLGSFSSRCLVPGTALPLSGRISSIRVTTQFTAEDPSWESTDLLALSDL